MSDNGSFLIRTDAGDVIVSVRDGASGLDDDFLQLEPAPEGAAQSMGMVTPLRAFGAKMLDLIEAAGTGEFSGSPTMREMLIKEKATQELKRIELFARRLRQD